jgi:hypothetical protein
MATKKATDSKPTELQRSWRLHRRLVRVGQALMIIGAVVAIIHWLAHLEAFGPGQPAGWLDFAAGYPTGGLIIVLGAILAGRKRPSSKQAPRV